MHLHENMLFRWVGYDVEMGYDKAKLTAPKRPLIAIKTELTDEQRKHYLDRLRDAFNPNKGLRASEYHCQDKVGKHAAAAEPKPCLFFTEQAAGDARVTGGVTGEWASVSRSGQFSIMVVARSSIQAVKTLLWKNRPMSFAAT
jgi:hypothetical protein